MAGTCCGLAPLGTEGLPPPDLRQMVREGTCDMEPPCRPRTGRSAHAASPKAADEPKTWAATNSSSHKEKGGKKRGMKVGTSPALRPAQTYRCGKLGEGRRRA